MDGKKRNFIREFITFNIVGIVNTVVTFLLYSLLVFMGLHYRVSLIMDYCLGMAVSFFLNKRITFRHTGSVTFRMVALMVGSYLTVFAINLILLTVFVEKCYMNTYTAQAAALSASALFSFFIQKFFVFRKKNPDSGVVAS
jgi:putative flippase GtrA